MPYPPLKPLTKEQELERQELERLKKINRVRRRPKPVHKISSAPTPAPAATAGAISSPSASSATAPPQAETPKPPPAKVRVAPTLSPKVNVKIFNNQDEKELYRIIPETIKEPRNSSINPSEIKLKGNNYNYSRGRSYLKVTAENREKANLLVARQQRFMATNEAKSLSYMRGGIFAAGAIGAGIGRYMAGEGEGEKTAGTGMGMVIGLTGVGIISNDIKKELKNNRANLDKVLRLTEDPSYYPFERAPLASATKNETKIKKELNLGENLTYESEEFNSLRNRHRVRTERNLPPSIAPSDAPKIGELAPSPGPLPTKTIARRSANSPQVSQDPVVAASTAPASPPQAKTIVGNIAPPDAPRIEMPIDPANEIGKIRDAVMPRTKIDITKQTAKREAMRAFHEANSASFYKGKNAAMLAATALLATGAGLAFNTADKSSGLNSKRGNRI